jgi:hypothetical protein
MRLMNDQMPMFDDPPPVEQPPKKPRKPMKPRKVKKAAEPKLARKRRKRRTVKVPKAEQHHGGKFPKRAYDLIGTLLTLDIPLRNFVMEVTKALTK